MTNGATQTEAEEYLTTDELCQRLHISRPTVYRHGLHAYAIKIGGTWRFIWSRVLAHYGQAQEPKPKPQMQKPEMLQPGTYRCTACGRWGDLLNPLPPSQMICSCGAVNQVERI